MGWRKQLYKQLFRAIQRTGFHLTPDHYYSPIPNTRLIEASRFEKRLLDGGIALPPDIFKTFARTTICAFRSEYSLFPAHQKGSGAHYFRDNPMFTGVDAAVYHALIRSQRPAKIVEVGSGYSTLVAAQAVQINNESGADYGCSLTAVEPYPGEFLLKAAHGSVKLIRRPVQEVPLEIFTELRAGDILFIDSSHVAKIGSDVLHEIFRILPQLSAGVLIHFHHIFLPFDYSAQYVQSELCFWNENYVLGAFLMFNAAFQVVWPAQFMHRTQPEVMRETFPWYDASLHNPTSFWIKRVES